MKEEEKKQAILKMEMKEMKKINKILYEKIEKLENVCVQKDLQMKIKENLLEILKADNEVQKKKTGQLNQLKSKINELERERQEQERLIEQLTNEINKLKAEKQVEEKMKAEKTSDHQEREKESAKNDIQENEQPKNEDTKKESKKETENKEEDKQKNVASANPLDMDIILDCCQEIEKGLQGYSRAYVVRGKRLLKLGLFDAARKDFETARMVEGLEECSKEGFEECSKLIEDAKAQRKKWVNQTHCEILGVSQTATTKEILKGFRVLAMKYHPDRHRGEPKFIQDGFEWRFKRVIYAKTVLTDERLRKSYDVWIRPKSGQKDQRHRRPKRGFKDMYIHPLSPEYDYVLFPYMRDYQMDGERLSSYTYQCH
ncbi:dnaJ homolog subfamily C member 7 homolog [Palaemon carinicauda]|uniref:dnaJ homolog subfamily C member 7 homolog n=1 Tax=Palaemon carinicauda TaxID=392227 RepID=UPI0035B5D635